MSEWSDDVYAVSACVAPGLFENLEIFDEAEEAHKSLFEFAEMIMKEKVVYTYDGEAVFSDKVLFLRVTRL